MRLHDLRKAEHYTRSFPEPVGREYVADSVIVPEFKMKLCVKLRCAAEQ